jgi:hypothetical protein
VIYCPNCGAENDDSARFCDNCGRDLEDARDARSGGGAAGGAQGAAGSPALGGAEETLWEGRPSPLTSPRMALTNRYKLTNRRLMIDHGFVGRRTEEIELYRFDDISVTQNIFERMTGKGDIHLSTSDSSAPEYSLFNVSDPDRVKDMIRDAAAKEHERRRIRYREDV